MQIAGFDWDEGNAQKCKKHGVELLEIEYVLSQNPIMRPDPLHSYTERRIQAVGKNKSHRYIFIVFTYRTKLKQRYIRPISARYMHQKETNNYQTYEKE